MNIEKSGGTRHYVYEEIGLIRGYMLVNETTENEGIIINDIKITINLSSTTGRDFYDSINGKFRPENLSPKYASAANYVYSEKQFDDIVNIEIKILTDRTNKREVIAKRKLLYKINKYT